jgi:hypothetical protein
MAGQQKVQHGTSQSCTSNQHQHHWVLGGIRWCPR